MKTITGQSHGKLILIGEHSVVYQKPSIALPFRAATISVQLEPAGNHSYLFSDIYEGPTEEAPNRLDALIGLFNILRHDFHLERTHFTIRVSSSLPIERGLGSSAALSVAFIRAFYQYLDRPLTTEDLLDHADYAETISHGHPSGLDARVTALNQPLLFQKGQHPTVFDFHTPYWLVVADSGIAGNTKSTVERVKTAYDSPYPARKAAVHQAIDGLGELTPRFAEALTASQSSLEALASIIQSAQTYLQSLQVSSPELDFGIQEMLKHGAAAAKLTGGGGGGCYYGLVETHDQALALQEALTHSPYASDTWLMPLSSQY